MHSTVTALRPIATQVAIGFNDEKPARCSALAMIDISKAFDSVDHLLLIKQICDSGLHPNYICWIASYLRGRTARCQYNGVVSRQLKIFSGTPQGSVLSPDLWNYYTSDTPHQAEIEEHYADDLDLLESDSQLDALSIKLDSSVKAVSEWAKSKNLLLSPEKSQVTLFTPWSKESRAVP
jgi:hypothetical protein